MNKKVLAIIYYGTKENGEIIDKDSEGISNPVDRQKIIKYVIDTFNTMIEELSLENQLVTHVDIRNTLQKNEWFDEVHPNNEGFHNISKVFQNSINNFELEGRTFITV